MIYRNFINKSTKLVSLVLISLSVFVACNKDDVDTTLNQAVPNATIDYENSDALFDRFYKANGALEITREYAKDVYLNSVANGFHVLKASGNQELFKENVQAFSQEMEEYVSLGRKGQSFFYLFTDKEGAAELAASGLPYQTLLSLQMEEKKQLMREKQLEISPFEEEAEKENTFFNEHYHLPYPSNDVFFEIDKEKAHKALHLPETRKYTITYMPNMQAMNMYFDLSKSTAKGVGHVAIATGNGQELMDANILSDQNGMKKRSFTKWSNRYTAQRTAKTNRKVS